MKIITMIVFLLCSVLANGQTRKSTMSEIGKVGNLNFVLQKTDTGSVLMIMQPLATYGVSTVFIKQKEYQEIAGVLKMFKDETSVKNPAEGTFIEHMTKDSVALTCSYLKKASGWYIMVMNPTIQRAAQAYRPSGGGNYFVQIKTSQLEAVMKKLLAL